MAERITKYDDCYSSATVYHPYIPLCCNHLPTRQVSNEVELLLTRLAYAAQPHIHNDNVESTHVSISN